MPAKKTASKGAVVSRLATSKSDASHTAPPKWIKESLGILSLALTIFIVLSLITVQKNESGYASAGGPIGAAVARSLWSFFGYGVVLIPLVLAFLGFVSFRHRHFQRRTTRLIGLLVLIPSLNAFLHLVLKPIEHSGYIVFPGGFIGQFLTDHLVGYIGNWGTGILSFSLVLISFLLATDISYYMISHAIKLRTFALFYRISDHVRVRYEEWKVRRDSRLEMRENQKAMRIEERKKDRDRDRSLEDLFNEPELPPSKSRTSTRKQPPLPMLEAESEDVVSVGQKNLPRPTISISQPAYRVQEDLTDLDDAILNDNPNGKRSNETFPRTEFFKTVADHYELPDLGLLDDPPPATEVESHDQLLRKAELLVEKLGNFSIQGHITEVCPGPVITRFEFEPAPGIKISKITALSDDLALGLRSKGGLRVAPIPGKSTLGIEVPNAIRRTVFLKETLGSDDFKLAAQKSILALPIGKDAAGHPYISDLKKMPHLLIAGATGSGKSVCINSILAGFLYCATPEQLRLILIDPKMLELSDFNGIPHLREPVITEVKKAPEALTWAVNEMEQRYVKLSLVGARNIDQFNAKVTDASYQGEERPLPYLVVVIDELADLMLTTASVVEESIQRLAQMARAAGIHLIIATQRPSVDVITGVIKANLPCRLAFQVASRVDSRTILDSMGAEKLLGMGDCLFIPPGTSQMLRLHGAYVSEAEVKKVVNFWRSQPPIDEESIFETTGLNGENGIDESDDPLYNQAVKLVLTSGLASISLLQRRLKLGHSRASRLIDIMEQHGIVGPHIGSKPREILVDRDEFLERLQQIQIEGAPYLDEDEFR